MNIVVLLAGEAELLLWAGIGWKPSLVGSEHISTGRYTEAVYTRASCRPVIVVDLASGDGRELTPAFDLAQPTISHHLKLLRQAGLIDCERRGTWVYYWALPSTMESLAAVLRAPQR